MKNLIFVLFFLFAGFSLSNAQEAIFVKGDKVVNLGIGLGNVLYAGSGYSTSVPPISASFEYGIKDGVLEKGSIGVGGYVGYTAAKWESTYLNETYGWKYSSFILGARGSFHYPFLEKLDTYAGLLIGFNVVSATEIGDYDFGGSASASGLAWSTYIGGRYYFKPNLAGMLELGYGISYLNLGVALKF